MREEKKDQYVVGSYFYNEESEWGWKYGFSLNKEMAGASLDI